MLTEQAIRDRFIRCLLEVLETKVQTDIAASLDTHSSYLTRIKTADNPSIPTILIARFCKTYNYSPHYILLGQGDKKTGPEPQEKKDIYYLRIIDTLTKALTEKKK